MRIVETFPRPVREIENVWIPLSDGRRLAARLWLPEDAETDPVPGILEYLPYRKRDLTRARDEPTHGYLAGHGYASVRVDVCGSGDSDGVLDDEYSERELADGEEVIAWIATQPWSTGRVGMTGISWGGFNALQVAARRPPALAAVITLCASDDRYTDDAHYMGGCLLNENLTWGAMLQAFAAYPPDPEISGERWRGAWRERLEAVPLFAAGWMRHPARDAYWRRGSVCEDYAAIEVPVYAIGGWADAYSNAVPRLLAGLPGVRKGLIGPWSHALPHHSVPGPRIGYLQEALRWWDRWLKGVATGVEDEPAYRVWMQEGVPPHGTYPDRPGRWVAEERWPSPRVEARRLVLAPGRLIGDSGVAACDPDLELRLSSPQTTGQAGGDWCAFGAEGELPSGQRIDDGRSLVFDTRPLPDRLEILGAPEVELELAADAPRAAIAARLCDVAPGGASTRVSYTLLDLSHGAHPAGHASPRALAPGARYRVRLRLNDVAHAFEAGHSVRLAVSTAYWPIAWPAPERFTLSLFPAAGVLVLPVRPPRPEDADLRPFEAPEQGPTLAHTTLRPDRFRRAIERDLATEETVYLVESEGGELPGAAVGRIDDIGLEVGTSMSRRYSIRDDDPASARSEVRIRTELRREAWRARVETRLELSREAGYLRLVAELRTWDGDEPFVERAWDERVPEDLAAPQRDG